MIKTFVVHPWSGTVFDADDGVITVNIPDDVADSMSEEDIVRQAMSAGKLIVPGWPL